MYNLGRSKILLLGIIQSFAITVEDQIAAEVSFWELLDMPV